MNTVMKALEATLVSSTTGKGCELQRTRLVIVPNTRGRTHGRSDAQPVRDNRENQTDQQSKQGSSPTDAAVRACQQRASAENRHEKRWKRWRARETTIVRRVSVHQPGPQDARDHRGGAR
jgi:hypothetical protein